MLLITVRDGSRLRAVLPLLEEKVWACGFPARKLRSAVDHTPRFDFIHGQGPGIEEALQAGWRELKSQNQWDIIELGNVPEGGAAERLLSVATRGRIPHLPTPVCTEPIHSSERKQAGLRISPSLLLAADSGTGCAIFGGELEKTGNISLRRVEAADPEILQQFYGLEQSGWKGKRGTAIACNRETRQFYDSIANYAAQYGYLSLYFLQQGDSVLAAHFGFTCGGGYYPLKVAYDERYSQYGPGHLIIGAVLQDCAARGLSEFDCLGHWTEAKAKWASQVRPHNFCYIFRRNLSGRILLAQTRLGHRLGADIRQAKTFIRDRATRTRASD